MRLRGLREPGAGFSEWSPMRSSCARGRAVPGPERCCSLIDLHQVLHRLDETAHGRVVLALRGAADLAEPERLKRVVLLAAGAVRGLDLSDHELGHAVTSRSSVSSASWTPSRPRTSRTVSPRSSAT